MQWIAAALKRLSHFRRRNVDGCPRCEHAQFQRIATKSPGRGVVAETYLCRACTHVEQRWRVVEL